MTPRPLALAAIALALVTGAAACSGTQTSPPGVRLRQPAAVAVFHGYTYTIDTPAAPELRPYLAVANSARNDISLIDPRTNTAVAAPIQLTTLVIPVEDRPSLLAAASLGDGKADLLVAVSAGDSVLQVVTTWNDGNVVFSSPGTGSPAVDLGADVLALAAIPSPPETARIAAALTGNRLAVVEWVRATDSEAVAIELADPLDPAIFFDLAFQPVALAAMPGDPTVVYAATPDALGPDLFGVAEIPLDGSPVRTLGARAPTRLVAAARLRERMAGSSAADTSAFAPDPVPRVYAVLDESACGPGRKIDCGVVTIDPTEPAGAEAIPADWAGRMPYRAPMRVPGRPLAIAVSGPPVEAPSDEPGDAVYQDEFMRLQMKAGDIDLATTGVAAVPSDDGNVYFLDLGRFKVATDASSIATSLLIGDPAAEIMTVAETPPRDVQLWLVDRDTTPASFPATPALAAKEVTVTPGYTPNATFKVEWEGILPGLNLRAAEAGGDTSGQPWLALQVGYGPAGAGRIVNEVVRLWHPAFGVQPGDIVVVKAAGVPAPCEGTTPASETTPEFEVEIAELLPPGDAYPGGALRLGLRSSGPGAPPTPDEELAWSACLGALTTAVTGGQLVEGLTATIRAKGLLLYGDSSGTGYAGRPALVSESAPDEARYALEYPADPAAPDEDELALACPLADWDGSLPGPTSSCPVPSVGLTEAQCREACEKLVLARKARRIHHPFEDCALDSTDTTACADRWPGLTFPIVNGPALAFEVAARSRTDCVNVTDPTCANAIPVRGLTLTLILRSGAVPLPARLSSGSPSHANGAIAFDRSPFTPADGYRFYVPYPADVVLDTSPSLTPAAVTVIR